MNSDSPCAQIQADLSAMLDGELDRASVRRVMVHSEICPSCRAFLDGIRVQARAHRDVVTCLTADPDEQLELGAGVAVPAAVLRRQLTENRDQLARIFYELGRGFVLMGLSPNFSRIVSREPVPIPDMFQRGKILVDEVAQVLPRGQEAEEWVRAKSLFDHGCVRSPAENLAKGTELLTESLMLQPSFHEARIYLGHAHHVAGRRAEAIREFQGVLDRADDTNARAFALLNLGNVYLEGGRLDEAIQHFLELVESGAIQESPRFGLIYFNLALAYGLQEQFQECVAWLSRLYSELPHKRRMIAEEFRAREQFAGILARYPEVQRRLADEFPCWFSLNEAC